MEERTVQGISPMLSVSDVQKIMGMNKNLAYRLVRQNDFPKITINGRYYIPVDSFRSWCKTYTGKEYSL